eukprot:15340945-Alexandrium_andersonii.AAC.1
MRSQSGDVDRLYHALPLSPSLSSYLCLSLRIARCLASGLRSRMPGLSNADTQQTPPSNTQVPRTSIDPAPQPAAPKCAITRI